MPVLTRHAPYQFAAFRIAFGACIFLYFARAVPHAAEIFSSEGMLPDAKLNHVYGYFPSIFYVCDAPLFVCGAAALLCLMALLFALGIARRPLALCMWYLWACFLNRNNFTLNPAVPVVGWLLLASALVPAGEPLAWRGKRNPAWFMPPLVYWGAWAVMGVNYSTSGVLKLNSPSWTDGSAVYHVLFMLDTRDWWLSDLFLALPQPILTFICYFMLAAELAFLPLCCFNRGRAAASLALICMHSGLILLCIFPALSGAMLLLHIFTFDAAWLAPLRRWRALQTCRIGTGGPSLPAIARTGFGGHGFSFTKENV